MSWNSRLIATYAYFMWNYQITGETMTDRPHRNDVPRQAADWMQPLDDRILELFREKGNLNPAAIEKFWITSANQASRRCSELTRYGLLARMAPGLYTITGEGLGYLDEELDASTLEPVDDVED